MAPNLVAGISFKLPPKLPMGVLTAETMKTSFDSILKFYLTKIMKTKLLDNIFNTQSSS
jgi:hypothetical protein